MSAYHSANTGVQVDAAITLTHQNKTDIVDFAARIAALEASAAHVARITSILVGTVVINATFAVLVAQDFTATVTGAAVGDLVHIYPALSAGYPATIGNANNLMCIGSWVSATNTVKCRWICINNSGDVSYNFTFNVVVFKVSTS